MSLKASNLPDMQGQDKGRGTCVTSVHLLECRERNCGVVQNKNLPGPPPDCNSKTREEEASNGV